MANDDVGAGVCHGDRVGLGEDIGRGEQVGLVRRPDHVDLQAVAHARLFQVGAEDAVDQAHGREVLHA